MRYLGIGLGLTLLAGCGGGEEIRRYLVAVDPAPLAALPASCYRGGTPPSPRVEDHNLYRDFTWTVWEAGSADRAFLVVESPEGGWRLGDAPPVRLEGAIAGTGDSFSAERVQVSADGQVLESTALHIVFEDLDTVSKGVVELKASCASCAGGSALSCEARLAFTAREEVLQE
ncbi:hypothetical protein [Vitiosangium sp. GDMCC 1.1324]|uniref:hypothetical protein n=1 Tax=Vitiosangium sp. (strain GDMCC 1.1324) TaxID=2138576 RepID=UPI000D36F2F0|nr:hypothetical protein [Vitiosangium sp. GDMCC 1.1324]PTL77324.1 hypothetical protein DAT35_45695 [Vitiosangium sp. GDMCC 1.1324]